MSRQQMKVAWALLLLPAPVFPVRPELGNAPSSIRVLKADVERPTVSHVRGTVSPALPSSQNKRKVYHQSIWNPLDPRIRLKLQPSVPIRPCGLAVPIFPLPLQELSNLAK